MRGFDMQIGKMNKRVALQQEQQTPDGAGGYTLAWTTLADVWANISPSSGREVSAAGRLEGQVTHKVTLRGRVDIQITTDMRLLYGTRAFNVRAVLDPNEDGIWAVLYVEEGVAT